DHMLAAQVDRGEVDLLDPAPGVDAGGQDRAVLRGGDARVVERDVDAPVPLRHRLVEPLHVVLVGHVGGDERAAGLLGDGLAGRLVDVDRYHDGPLIGEPACAGPGDAAGR